MEIQLRDYQKKIVNSILEKGNSLVVLPTGTGKTVIAAAIINEFKEGKKIIFLAPTRPLCHQHKESLEKMLSIDVNEIIGKINANKRSAMWEGDGVFVSTPQVVRNDIISGRLRPEEISLLIIDEAHHAVGNYAYVFVAKQCNGLIVGLTASPGSEKEKIKQICDVLGTKNIEWDKKGVEEYQWNNDILIVPIHLPSEFKNMKNVLEDVMREKLRALKELDFIKHAELKKYNKSEFLKLRGEVIKEIGFNKSAYTAISLISSLLLLYHGHDVLETQGIGAFLDYFKSLEEKKRKGAKNKSLSAILIDERIKNVVKLGKFMYNELGMDHPKIEYLKKMLETRVNENNSAIVFANYRSTAERLAKVIENEKIKPIVVVGQSKKGGTGINQKEQIERIDKFKNKEYNVLIGTQVLEEGLDISSVDYVFFYEAVPSAIRSIQRAGRTGRFRAGEIVLLIAKGTKDEAYYWSSQIKERKMEKAIKEIKDEFQNKQSKISNFI